MSAQNHYGELMRINKEKHNHHGKFKGEIARIKKSKGMHGFESHTVLIKNIVNVVTGETISERMWFEYTEEFDKVGKLREADIISFESTPKAFTKRTVNDDGKVVQKITGYTFGNPKKIKLVTKGK